MQNKYNNHLGGVIKSARLRNQLTRKQLAEKLHISQRHLTAIENEEQQPSYDLLFSLIRELQIPSDMIFYPERQKKFGELDQLQHLLRQCDSKDLNIVMSTVQSLLDNKSDMR
ncbi:helix-turn-helix transcriptional regulator [Mobilisporobacter senegalensis]|uniref:helix-turn-helix transcriptional regulator n=1 Tax=Mobilisporobacter senegalensis TaxID=1329262 RepID=UPI000F46E4AE|nr:helix-turn-helix transcriptional regulator [Mobilisporobacter senegalensis]